MTELRVETKVNKFIEECEVVEVYLNVLRGNNRIFPRLFWSENGKHNLGIIIRYIQTDILGCDVESMYQLKHADFGSLRLWGALRVLYDNRFIDAIMDAYTDSDGNCPLIKHRFKKLPNAYWTVESYIDAIRFEVKDKFSNLTASELMEKWSCKFVVEELQLAGAHSQLKSVLKIKETLLLAFPRNFTIENCKIVVADEEIRF